MGNSENKKPCCCGTNTGNTENTGNTGNTGNTNNTDCCTPKPKSRLTKIIFIVVITAALGIIGYKLYSNHLNIKEKPPCCADSAKCKSADKTNPCCAHK
jgi:hypothetical protein